MKTSGICAILVALAVFPPARASEFSPISNPTPFYVTHTSLIPIPESDFSIVSSITDGVQVVTFSPSLEAFTVPDTWFIWGSPPHTETSTPRVLWTQGSNDLEMDLLLPSVIFGFEAQPDLFGPFAITADFYSGSGLVGSITRTVDGFGGALLFAAETETLLFTKVIVHSDDDFAIARVRYALTGGGPQIPEPATAMLLSPAVLLLVLAHRRLSKTVRS